MTGPERRLLVFGYGYTARRLGAALSAKGWTVAGTTRQGGAGTLPFDDPLVLAWVRQAPFILSTVPPAGSGDPVLERWGAALRKAKPHWLGYLSSTAVYGDTGGAWVDETSPVGGGRRTLRTKADGDWQALGAHVFRLPGIYGPGRSPFDRLHEPGAQRIDKPGHVFCRIHVDDIVQTLIASMAKPVAGGRIYNVVDDEPAESRAPIEEAARLLGVPTPPLVAYDQAELSPMARGFYSECRRVKGERVRQELGVRLRYPSYREGLAAILAEERQS